MSYNQYQYTCINLRIKCKRKGAGKKDSRKWNKKGVTVPEMAFKYFPYPALNEAQNGRNNGRGRGRRRDEVRERSVWQCNQ